jgi:hypothetical protein
MKLTHLTIDEATGNVDVRWLKPAKGDKGPEPHRCSFEAGGDADRMFSMVKQDREAHGFTVNDADLDRIKEVCAIAATPEHLAAADERRRIAYEQFLKDEAERKAQEEADAKAAEERKAADKAAFDAAVREAVAALELKTHAADS